MVLIIIIIIFMAGSGAGALHRAQLNEHSKDLPDEVFDTTIHGPWMGYWAITHHNRHTQAMLNNKGKLSWHSWNTQKS